MRIYWYADGSFKEATGASIFAQSEDSDIIEFKLPGASADSIVHATFLLPYPQNSDQFGHYIAESLLMHLEQDTEDGGYVWRATIPGRYLVNNGTAYISARVESNDLLVIETTEQVMFEIQPGGAYEATPVLPEQAEQIEAELTSQNLRIIALEGDVETLDNTKQDKNDNGLETTNKSVVGAINEVNSTNNTQNQQISSLNDRVSEIEQTYTTGENFIGEIKGDTLPEDTTPPFKDLDAEVLEVEGRAPKNGDVVIFILQQAGTDRNFKYYYTNSGWKSYEIPPMEKAGNGTAGLIEGTYTVGATADTLVDITAGKINAIYVKNNNNTYTNIKDYLNSHQREIQKIISGDTQVGNALKAVQDALGNNIVNTYLTKEEGATKQYVRNYAVPRVFNDVYFVATNGYQPTVPTTPASGVQFTLTTSAVGDFTLFEIQHQNTASYELSSKNSSQNNIFVSADRTSNVYFRMTTQIYTNNQWKTLSIELSDLKQMTAGEIYKVTFSSSFIALGNEVLTFEDGSIIRQKLEVVTETSAETTFDVYSNEAYPSTFNLNIQSQTLIERQGAVGEIVQLNLYGDLEDDTISYEIPSGIILEPNTLVMFNLFYADPIASGTKIQITQNSDVIQIKTPYNIDTENTATIDELAQVYKEDNALRFIGFIKEIGSDFVVYANVDDLRGIEAKIPVFETNVNNIKMNGTASLGVLDTVARADHIHPSDTTKQDLIDANNKLDADLIDDSNASNKFVTAQDILNWNAKQNALPTTNVAGKVLKSTNSAGVVEWGDSASEDTWRPVKVNGVEKLSNSTSGNALDLKAGDNVTISESDGQVTINATDTTYTQATWNNFGLIKLGAPGEAQSVAAVYAVTGRQYAVQLDANGRASVNVPWTDTTYENKAAAQGGTDVSLVTTGDKYNWNNKQAALDATQLAAVNSGADTTKIGQIATNAGAISAIQALIPNEASASNQLADKDFVNSTVQTGTANFRGNWATWADVPTNANDYPLDYAQSRTPTVNDYIVVQDASGYTGETLTGTWRFKYSGVWATNGKNGWHPEYQVNETPLTAAQLAALNSGITAALVTQIGTNQTAIATLQANAVTGVSYASATKKLQQTKNGSTTDIVTFGANAFTDTTIPTSASQIGGEVTTNKVTSISSASTNAQYPSAKLLYDQLLLKQNVIDANNKLDYSLLANTPTIPTVNNPTITITQGGVTKGSFTLNQASGDTINLDAGGGGSETWTVLYDSSSDDPNINLGLTSGVRSSTGVFSALPDLNGYTHIMLKYRGLDNASYFVFDISAEDTINIRFVQSNAGGSSLYFATYIVSVNSTTGKKELTVGNTQKWQYANSKVTCTSMRTDLTQGLLVGVLVR